MFGFDLASVHLITVQIEQLHVGKAMVGSEAHFSPLMKREVESPASKASLDHSLRTSSFALKSSSLPGNCSHMGAMY